MFFVRLLLCRQQGILFQVEIKHVSHIVFSSSIFVCSLHVALYGAFGYQKLCYRNKWIRIFLMRRENWMNNKIKRIHKIRTEREHVAYSELGFLAGHRVWCYAYRFNNGDLFSFRFVSFSVVPRIVPRPVKSVFSFLFSRSPYFSLAFRVAAHEQSPFVMVVKPVLFNFFTLSFLFVAEFYRFSVISLHWFSRHLGFTSSRWFQLQHTRR